MYDNFGDLCALSVWQLVRWWRGPARCLHVHGWLLFGCWRCHRVRGRFNVVHIVHSWPLVRWKLCRSSAMRMCLGLLFRCWRRCDVRRHNYVVRTLRGRQCLRGQRCRASLVHLYCGVRLDHRNFERVHGKLGELCCVCCWKLVRGWRSPICSVHLQRRLLF